MPHNPNTKCITERNTTKYAHTTPVQSHCFFDLGSHGTAMNHNASRCTQTIDFAQTGQSEYRGTASPRVQILILVELTGIEPVASWLQTRRSPS